MPSVLADVISSTSTGPSSLASPQMTTSTRNNFLSGNTATTTTTTTANNNNSDSAVAAIFEKKRVQKVIPGISNGPHAYRHPYWFVCHSLPPSYWNYESATIDYSEDVSPYELVQKIGRGKYSEVFLAANRANGCFCVLKVLKPVRLRKIKREITILQNLCGGPNVVRLLDVLYDADSSTPVLVTEFVPEPCTLRSLMLDNTLTNFDLRYYMYEVLRTLEFAHSRGIFHRDIKPHNIMINHERRFLRVIDWGLAEYYIHGEPLNCGVATRHYKGPELVLGYRHYDYSLDIWCVGCVLAGLLFRIEPLFNSSSNEDHLVKLVTLFGSTELNEYVRKYRCEIPAGVRSRVTNISPMRLKWTKLIPKGPEGAWCDATALDLVDKMLQFDHANRITAAEAMAHPFFAPVRAAMRVKEQRSGRGSSRVESSQALTESTAVTTNTNTTTPTTSSNIDHNTGTNNNNNNASKNNNSNISNSNSDARGSMGRASILQKGSPLHSQTSAGNVEPSSFVSPAISKTTLDSTRAAAAAAASLSSSSSSNKAQKPPEGAGGGGVASGNDDARFLQEQYPRKKKSSGVGGAGSGSRAATRHYLDNEADSSDSTSSVASSSRDGEDDEDNDSVHSRHKTASSNSMSLEEVYALAARRR